MPDVYQGDELWNLLLVDPDNRRPVAWDVRRALLRDLDAGGPIDHTTAKLFTLRTLLALRARSGGLIGLAYTPLAAPGDVCAFTRGESDAPVVRVVVPVRPMAALPADLLPDGWTDVLAPLDALLGDRRPAVLVRR